MKLDKNNIKNEDKEFALKILNKLRMQEFLFGNPAEGLKRTLNKKEKELDENKNNSDKWYIEDKNLKSDINKLKSGIKGELILAEYIQKEIKENNKLDGLLCFASLCSNIELEDELGYIPDSDFLLIYGNNILILDSKYIITNPDMPIYIFENKLMSVNKELFEVSDSTYIWKNILNKNNIKYNSITGCIVIVNKNGALIWRNDEWYKSNSKPVYIGELSKFLEDWIENIKDDNILSLNMLVQISKTQIRKSKSNLNLRKAQLKFKI